MIEIPKYSVPTYDPKSTAVNQRTDFTRRIPTGLSEKQMGRDAKIMMQIVRAEGDPDKIIDIFCRKAHLLSNPRYWELMRTVWVAAGSTETANLFRRMMQSSRPCKSWFMTPEDAAALDAMEFPITVYRAYDAALYPDDTDPGLSWTPDEQWCREYAKANGRVVKMMQVSRDQVFAYVSRRGEEEIIIL
jgi:hypothetical protein